MKILLLMPWEKDYKSFRDKFSNLLVYAPLTLVTLAALVPSYLNAEVEVCDEMVQSINFEKHYDIVAISFVTPSSVRAYKIAKKFKSKGSYIVFGGYHTTFAPEEASKHAHTIITGVAERSFKQFLIDFSEGKPKTKYEDTCISKSDFVVPKREFLPKHGYLNVPGIIANPGCINKCDFCVVSDFNASNARNVKDVISEIKSLKTKKIIFFDPNFFQNKQYTLELMSEIKKLKIKWASTATVNTAFDIELVQEAQKSGCIGVLMGLESINKASLIGAKKGFNNPKKYKEAINIMHNHNISVNGCFVLGFDSDTKENLLSLPEQVEYLGLNLVRYAILTPVPNSKLYNRLLSENRIITTDWRKYTHNKVVFKPKNMSPKQLQDIYIRVWKSSYKIPKILKRIKNAHTLSDKALLFGANLGFKYVAENAGRE